MNREYEFSVLSQGRKKIDVLVINPEMLDKNTGFMLVIHGWGGNRYQYRQMMLDFSNRYNLVCVSPEYRDCGYDATPEGRGIRQPYDFSHLQVIDALSSFRSVLLKNPELNHKRSFIWGGSQGGHIALLATEFAPHTFALTVDACGIVYPTDRFWEKAGWKGEGAEFEIRDARRFVNDIQNKVIIFHGNKDESVDIRHSYELEKALKSAGKEAQTHYFPGGDHLLRTTITRMEATIQYASQDISSLSLNEEDDFSRRRQTILECTDCNYVVDFKRKFPVIRKLK